MTAYRCYNEVILTITFVIRLPEEVWTIQISHGSVQAKRMHAGLAPNCTALLLRSWCVPVNQLRQSILWRKYIFFKIPYCVSYITILWQTVICVYFICEYSIFTNKRVKRQTFPFTKVAAICNINDSIPYALDHPCLVSSSMQMAPPPKTNPFVIVGETKRTNGGSKLKQGVWKFIICMSFDTSSAV